MYTTTGDGVEVTTKVTSDSGQGTLITASVSASLSVLFLVGVTVIVVVLLLCIRRSRAKVVLQFNAENEQYGANVTPELE